ncbi:MAG: TonB-dependent receptor [Steroidobacteraceae bacterium]
MQTDLFFFRHSGNPLIEGCRFPASQSLSDCRICANGGSIVNINLHLARAVRLAIGGAAGLTAAFTSPVGLSQEAESLQEVVITGSRIRQDPLERDAPVLTVTSEDMQRAGLNSVGDFLQRLPVSGGSINSKFNSSGNFGFPPSGGGVGAGATTADLRYLGSNRVLVLVDGVRWVNESSASGVSSATDLNTIPTSIIERIEVLQDGASAIYGSDAIAGVINIITKKDFDGLEFSGYAGGFDEGDGSTQEYSVSLGKADDRSSVFFSLNYVDQRRIASRNRDISQFPTPDIGACTPFCSSGTPQARILFTDPNTGFAHDLTVNDGVTGIPFYDPSIAPGQPRTDDFHEFTTADRFNFAEFNLVQTPSERVGVYGQGTFELTPGVDFYLKGLYNNRRSVNQAAPEPLFIGTEAGNGNLLDTISVDATNPFNPFGFTLEAPANSYFIGRRPLEGGPRIFSQNVDTWYLGGGVRGEFEAAGREFFWDVGGAWSRNRGEQSDRGTYNSQHILEALGPAFEDPNSPGTFLCGTPGNVIAGCVPLNVFGGQGDGSGTITQEMLGFILANPNNTSEQELVDWTANVTGSIVELPAGPLAFAVGFEHREQDGFYQPDQIYIDGESAGVPSSPTSGGFEIDEFYGELQVPILADAPGADLLEVSLAARTSDYSTFGSETTTKYGLRWRPHPNLLLRGTFAEGFRAPGIGELFGSQARFDQTLQDQCSDYTGALGGPPAPAEIQANCQALGVPATYEQINQQISVTTGGNPDLRPETADSVTYGIVYSPGWAKSLGWVEDLSFEVNYYEIELNAAIQAIPAQVQLDTCITTLDPVLCGDISRTAGGTINSFSNQLTNIGGIETSGFDVNIIYAGPETGVGQFQVTWLNSFLEEFTEIIPTATGFQNVTREGTEIGDPEQAFPEFKSTLILDWFSGDWNASWTLRYIDEITESCTGLQAFPGLCSNPNAADDSLSTNKLDATIYNDVQVSWTPSQYDGLRLQLGIRNLFDEDPPSCFSCALNGFDATTHDVPGIYGYIRATYAFERL